jgi:hypothetical protein
MGGIYAGSLMLDSAIFTDVTLPAAGVTPWPFIAKLGAHTAMIAAYLAGTWMIIRRK